MAHILEHTRRTSPYTNEISYETNVETRYLIDPPIYELIGGHYA